MGTDPGIDGGTTGSNQNFARDAFGYTLNYFSGDYQAIDPNKSLSANNFIASTNNFTNLAVDAPNLYNGNISSMVTTIKNPTTGDVLPQFTMYKYDQLNRLKNMKAFASFNFTSNEWNYSTYTGRYQNDFTYDANGNIETAVANNANGDVIDNQVYNYYKPGNNKQNNRLYSITDIATITSGKDLPSGQIAFDNADLLNNNYRYNELGELVYDKQMGIDEITWDNNGKIRTVTHSEASGKYNLKFDYNHTGKRIAKHVYNQNNTLLRSEYYTRDASDNVMAVYRLEVDEQNQEVSFRLKERHIYSTSMLGIDRQEVELIDPVATNNTQSHIVGLKSYTGSNHLGNVLTTFSDKKLPVDENSDGIIDYYKADIISSSDYAPFGAQLAERSFFSENYPNSFNGKRDDPELGDWQDYGMRMYSPWKRRFETTDPLMKDFPWNSTYAFAENDVIRSIDLDGLEKYPANTSLFYVEVKGDSYKFLDTRVNESLANFGLEVQYKPSPWGKWKDPGYGWIKRENNPAAMPDDGSGGYAPKLYSGNKKSLPYILTAPTSPSVSSKTGQVLTGIGGVIELANIALSVKDAYETFDYVWNVKYKIDFYTHNYNKAFKKALEIQNDNMKFLPNNMRTINALADVTNYALDGTMPKSEDKEYLKNVQSFGNDLINRLGWEVRPENQTQTESPENKVQSQ